MLPTHYGTPPNSFGIFHPAEKLARSQSLIVCPPLFGEVLGAHWAILQIARRAARQGYDVFRFDFSGTGNSLVDPSDLTSTTWIDDVEVAIDFVEQKTGSKRVSILAVRFGFAVAASVTLRRDIEHLIGWDPVLDGRVWLADRMVNSQELSDGSLDIEGHALSKSLISEIAKIETRTVDSVQCSAVTTARHVWNSSPEVMGIECVQTAETWDWVKPRQMVFYANASIKLICEHLS